MKISFVFLMVVCVCAHGSRSVVYNITSLVNSPAGTVELMNGKSLYLGTPLTNGVRVLFEDLHPGANWSHPARYSVVGIAGEIVKTVSANFPPRNFNELLPVVAGDPVRPGNSVDFKMDDFQGKYRVANPSGYHAILINGQADQRHWNDFSFLYRVLTQIYGYAKSNIFVLDGAFKDRQGDLDGDGTQDIGHSSNSTDLKEVLGMLKGRLGIHDQLLIAVNDHGSTEGDESTIVLYDGEMKSSEFATLLKDLPAGRLLSIYEQCFSGGFVRPSVGQRRVSMAAATNQEYSWASMDLLFDEFIYHVISAFAMQTHGGTPVKSDLNADGKISAQEAFAYATGADKRPESPVLEAFKNAGFSAQMGVGF